MKLKLTIFILLSTTLTIKCEDSDVETTSNDEKATTEADVSEDHTKNENSETQIDKNDENVCDNPPSTAMFRSCCTIPHGYHIFKWNQCNKKHTDDYEKATKCYVNETKVIVDGKIDKKLIEKYFTLENTSHNNKWKIHIENAIEKCEYEEKSSVSESLAIFLSCINDHLAENCAWPSPNKDCQSVIEYFDNCGNISCEEMSSRHMAKIEFCCIHPSLSNFEMRANCRYNCSKKFFTESEIHSCAYMRCNEEYPMLLDDDKEINLKVAKEILMKSVKNKSVWEEKIDESLAKCTKMFKQSDSNDKFHKVYAVGTCLNECFNENCMDFESSFECQRLKKFLKKCPDSKHKFTKHYHGTGH